MLDADDLVEPDRNRLDAAKRLDGVLATDHLILVSEGIADIRSLSGNWPADSDLMTVERFPSGSKVFGQAPDPGLLKPIFRGRMLANHPLWYKLKLCIGKGDELVVRMLQAGVCYPHMPKLGFRYRKHEASISHCLPPDNCAPMVKAETVLRERFEASGSLPKTYHKRRAALLHAQAYACSIERLQERRFLAVAKTMLAQPSPLGLY